MLDYNGVVEAKKNISDYIQETPMVKFDKNIYLKMENTHSIVNAFKIRGAYNAMKKLKTKKVVCVAMGSFGFAVGVIGRILGIKTVCFMPNNATSEKILKMKSLVDEVIISGDNFFISRKNAEKYAKKNKIAFLHPYNNELAIMGKGTIGLEIYKKMPDVSRVYVPACGGSMLLGLDLVFSKISPKCKIIGVQPEVMHSLADSIRKGRPEKVAENESIADPLAININKDDLAFSNLLQFNKDGIYNNFILVSEKEIAKAMKMLWEETGYMVEGAGAISLAAALKDPDRKRDEKVVCVVSGSNIDYRRFQEVIGNV